MYITMKLAFLLYMMSAGSLFSQWQNYDQWGELDFWTINR